MEKSTYKVNQGGKWRIPFGILLFLAIWFASVLLIIVSEGYVAIPVGIILLILFLFLFGVLGWWLLEFDILGAINPLLLFFGKICGYVGFFIRPFPILLYGANKKWILNVCILIPMAIVCLLCALISFNILPSFNVGYINFNKICALKTAIVSIIFSLFVLGIKKCPACKCIMSKIEFDSVDFSKTKYYTSRSENIGYMRDTNGNTVDVYQNVINEHNGMRNKFAKTYTCKNCGSVKYGIKFNAVTRI